MFFHEQRNYYGQNYCRQNKQADHFPMFHDYAPINNQPYSIIISYRVFIIHGKTFIQFFVTVGSCSLLRPAL